jgi:redox-sensitive bicupin YhaK (pirin superfamily)
VHVIRGEIDANGQALAGGDALKIAGESEVRISNGRGAEVLVFDLP